MKYLIVGLGNIGQEYANTRHNIGFMVLDRLAKQAEASFDLDKLAYISQIKHKGQVLQLVKPTTYMNLSGKAVNYWQKMLDIPTENILVVVDDLALPFGTLRMRKQGSHAGHNGLKDIEAVLGNNQYTRIRFGIGSDFPKGRQVDYVLGNFNENESAELPIFIDKTIEMIFSFALIGADKTMTAFNK
ncbi:MAG: aminoacyl-tRNA hydrolase [Bacteroidetes bacterium]|nr:MAG: aminoacyl-tRNA hydrolase [Bacteroidota bacterium]